MKFSHIPIMTKEILSFLKPKYSGQYLFVDATLGGGGHSKKILESIPNSKIIGIDQDQEAIKAAKDNLAGFKSKVTFINENFSKISEILATLNIQKIDGILFDLGVSSYQLENPERGFSFSESKKNINSKLDMRMDQNQRLSAQEVLNNYSEKQLIKIFFEYGEEQYSKQIAREIIKFRDKKRIQTTKNLLEIIKKSTPPKYRYKKREGHYASKIFRAIRMEVNQELKSLEIALKDSIKYLKKDSRIVVITFHSLEDRLVKNIFQKYENPCTCPPEFPVCVCNKKPIIKIITKKSIQPSDLETMKNPKARSAQIRIAQKIIDE